MNKIALTIICILSVMVSAFAQTPDQFSYQAALRNTDGSVMANEEITVNIAILAGSESGTEVFNESHDLTTSDQGIINLNVGSVEDLSVVEWAENVFFLKITVDGTEMGTSQIVAAPYALNAKHAENAYWDINTDKIYYTGGEVGIGINAPEENLHVVGGAKFGMNGIVMDEMIELTGTTSDTDGHSSLSYPTGYDKGNTRIIGFEVQYLSTTWMAMGKHSGEDGSISAGLGTDNIYLYYPNVSSFQSRPYRLILMKVQ